MSATSKVSKTPSRMEEVKKLKPLLDTIIHEEKLYPRQQSAPQFSRRDTRSSRFGLGMFSNYMFPGGHLREFTDEESNFAAMLQKAMDLEGVDRETVHMLVSLLMKFMIYSDQEKVNDDFMRNKSKAQNIVLRHLNVLLGYNQTEKAFSVPPYKLRYSAVFNAYLAGLAEVLDKNFQLGNLILPVAMLLLQYSPSPQRYASDYQPPNYTLWYLEPHTRQSWLTALIVILYKYQYHTTPANGIIQFLMRITVNTLEAQLHRCKSHDDAFGPSSPMVTRNRDTSNVSVGDLENIQETDTPPQSPTDSAPSGGESVTINMPAPADQGSVAYKKKTESDKTEETDADSVESMSKLPSPSSKSITPVGAGKSPPGVSSPTSVTSPTSKAPVKNILSGHKKEQVIDSPTDLLAKRQMDQDRQAKRIAEYRSDSLTEKTLEKSMEEFVFTGSKNVQSDETDKAGGSEAKSVEQKMAEQILQFESQSEAKKKGADQVLSPKKENKTVTIPEVITTCQDETPKPNGNAASVNEGKSDENSKENQDKSGGETEKCDKAEKKIPERIPIVIETQNESEVDESPCPSPNPNQGPKFKPHFRQRKVRKTGLTTVELQKMIPELSDTGVHKSPCIRKQRKSEAAKSGPSQKRSVAGTRLSEHIMVDRCPECNAVLEQYDEETISLCIVAQATFIHREPTLAAPLLLDMLQAVSRIAASSPYPWQAEISGLIIPGNCVSVARQFLRCVLHQLAPNGIFPQLFQTELEDPEFLKTLAIALVDFNELNCYSALQLLLEGVNEMKTITPDQIMHVLINLSRYLECIALETSSPAWANILTLFDTFFRRLPSQLPNPCDMNPVLKIIICVLKIPGLTSVKTILDPFSKLLNFAIEHCSFKLQHLLDICCLCSRAFTKERDKLYLTHRVIFGFSQALKFRTVLPDDNLLMLVQFVCLDAGGTLGPTNISEELSATIFNPYAAQSLMSTSAAECMKQHLNDCVEFIADLHTINKIKSNVKGGTQNLNEDTLGSQLKAGIAQYIALEFTKGNGRDNRAITRYLPWLYHPPSTMQQGPKEFIDCVGHIRLLSWLLLGSLTHTAITKSQGSIVCQPIPLEASSYIADHVMVIMTGFAEQSKASVLHMSSLFHAFILCQLWTMYCESVAALSSPVTENYLNAHATIMDFWGRVTPGVLQLLSHSKVLAEMVNLHFLGLMEALQECNSTVLSKLFPMWMPILFSYHSQLPGHMQVRLQMCQNWKPRDASQETTGFDSDMLLKWLKRLQFKLGQIEVQSSAATQFYIV